MATLQTFATVGSPFMVTWIPSRKHLTHFYPSLCIFVLALKQSLLIISVITKRLSPPDEFP